MYILFNICDCAKVLAISRMIFYSYRGCD